MFIESYEVLARGIVHPMFYSQRKGKLDRNAFMPPPRDGGRNVSLYRCRYASEDTCKFHASQLQLGRENKYCGIAVFQASIISDINQKYSGSDISSQVIATPLDEQGRYVNRDKICKHDLGIPFHADLRYEFIVHEGQVNTSLRVYAQQICTLAQYCEDPYPNGQGWKGKPFGLV